MEWIERLNDAIKYIEENLTEDIDYDELGKITCCSSYHFQRMFAYMADVTLSEYIRRRKMSLAAVDLQDSNMKIVDVSLKYGYNSPTAFNRAFQMVHGIAPSSVKNGDVSVKSFPPLVFKITVKGAVELEYRIVTKEEFRIMGVSKPLFKELEKNFEIVPAMWQEASMNGTLQKLIDNMNAEPMGVLGVCVCPKDEEWRYFIAVSSTNKNDELEELIIPPATWAVFSGEGKIQSIQELEQRILTEWLPTSGYEYGNAPDIEVYLNADPQNAKYEVWIPVVKK